MYSAHKEGGGRAWEDQPKVKAGEKSPGAAKVRKCQREVNRADEVKHQKTKRRNNGEKCKWLTIVRATTGMIKMEMEMVKITNKGKRRGTYIPRNEN